MAAFVIHRITRLDNTRYNLQLAPMICDFWTLSYKSETGDDLATQFFGMAWMEPAHKGTLLSYMTSCID
jgi:hypothetical protein